jgi:hypothetical protein
MHELNLVIDTFFLIDICLNFFTSFIHPFKKVEVTSQKEIAINYIKGWFFFDLISIIPIYYFFPIEFDLNNLLRLARLSRLNKVVKLVRLLKMFRQIKINHI